jgi:hypothetical protein
MTDKGKDISKVPVKAVVLVIGCLLLIAPSYFSHHAIEYSNESCRYMLIKAVVDYHSLSVDKLNPNKFDDVSFYKGHFYSAKAIGAPMLGIPVYRIMKCVSPLTKSVERYLIRIFVSTLPFCILGMLLFLMAERMGVSPANAYLMVLAYSFGSISIIHAMLFSGHQTAASFTFFSFALLYMTSSANNRIINYLSFFSAGLLAGVGALCDYTAIYIAFVITAYMLSLTVSWKCKMLFIVGGAICASLLGIYNAICFGNPLHMSYSVMSNARFSAGVATGFLGIALPKTEAIWSLLFSPSRGLFFIMPVFLYSLAGFVRMWRMSYRKEVVAIISICFGYLMMISGFYGWHGGWTFGPRYLVPMLPFLALPMAFAPLRSVWFLLLFFISALQVLIPASVFIAVSEQIVNPILEIILPFFSYGYSAYNLGNYIGLEEPWSFMPLLFVLFVLVCWGIKLTGLPDAKRESILIKITAAGMAVWIILSLAFIETPSPKTVHCFRAQRLVQSVQFGALKKDLRPVFREIGLCEKMSLKP